MKIYFYHNESDPDKIVKSLSNEIEVSGSFRDQTGVIDVIIIVSGDEPPGNYFYIPDFNRYYFVTGISSVRTGLTEIRGHVDVLTSFADEILALPAIIDKSENIANGSKYLNDGSYNPSVKQYTESYTFSDPDGATNFIDTPKHILITAG